jgi:hypothetical protein
VGAERSLNGAFAAEEKMWKALGLAAVLFSLLAFVVFWGVRALTIGGTSDLPVSTWIAMAGGVITALAVGIGLMSLVFFSSRRGYDDEAYRSQLDDWNR